ncbi:NAD(+) kinase [Halorhodospira halophila]|uniref:NAD kinase n=1 Tax=Halorhodospira halophila (strain DSM 244 / SL1) TaxID=349124 RepID=NADK_HALHL|nr:NAD(+) kinase [Halorhodospira halophila]A1WX34.1 RecName: Full=NAD kinase; AltName: Full=ATP-dependent NAD kinase [Halorhodospira halophila SL1]ABM62246.1 NAD(+) kinase [Halorhodospira halophila SL1]MBK1729221.1 NAD kinase [Halorhodospira halophila]
MDEHPPPPFPTVGIIGKPGDPAIAGLVERLLPMLEARGCTALLDEQSMPETGDDRHPQRVSRETLLDACDLIIAIGGDGTLIHIARAVAGRRDVALMGINRGRLGFLVDIAPEHLDEVAQILDGQHVVDERLLLHAEIRSNEDDTLLREDVAINEVVLHRWNTARMIELVTRIDGEPLSDHRSDGLILATPTGSTAYAMAGGGPIVHPNLHAMLLVPVCPHTLSNRPLVVDGSSRIEIDVHPRFIEHVRVSCDSQNDLTLQAGSRLVVRAHPSPVRLVHPPGYSYFNLLRAKLGWGGPLCNIEPFGA